MHPTIEAALVARRTGAGIADASMMLDAATVIRWAVNEVRQASA
jgi:hypothetical protein